MIRTYANTVAERNTIKIRLDALLSRKEKLYEKYFSTSAKISETGGGHTNQHKDKMAEYMAELTEVNEITGKSLDGEIEEYQNKLGEANYYIRLMDYELENTTGIENEIFKMVAKKGINPTKAVNLVAEKYDKDVSTIWKYNYPKIEKEIKKIIKVQ